MFLSSDSSEQRRTARLKPTMLHNIEVRTSPWGAIRSCTRHGPGRPASGRWGATLHCAHTQRRSSKASPHLPSTQAEAVACVGSGRAHAEGGGEALPAGRCGLLRGAPSHFRLARQIHSVAASRDHVSTSAATTGSKTAPPGLTSPAARTGVSEARRSSRPPPVGRNSACSSPCSGRPRPSLPWPAGDQASEACQSRGSTPFRLATRDRAGTHRQRAQS